MKVIDLLNKIANYEKVPKRIKYNNLIYVWDKVGYLHYRDDIARECAFLEGVRTDMVLNDEVELIEDEIDIQEVNAYKLLETPYMADLLRDSRFDEFAKLLKQSELELVEKINKLADRVKQLDKKIKEKD